MARLARILHQRPLVCGALTNATTPNISSHRHLYAVEEVVQWVVKRLGVVFLYSPNRFSANPFLDLRKRYDERKVS